MAISRLVCCAVCVVLSLFADLRTAVGATRGIWISRAEVLALPMSGTAWNNVRSAAYASWGAPDLANQDQRHASYCLAGALVYVRTGDAALGIKARDGIMAAKRSLDSDLEYDSGARTLALGRQLAAYVVAADLIDLESFAPDSDAVFRPWLDALRGRELAGSNATHGKSLRKTFESGAHNWGFHAGASLVAADLYLGQSAAVARDWLIFKAYSDRSQYPPDAWVPSGWPDENYFTRSGWDPTWTCGTTTTWTGISPSCMKTDADGQTADIDGCFPSDIRRTSSSTEAPFQWYPAPAGMEYSWCCLDGLLCQAEMLYRGGYPTAYTWGNSAVKRAMDFMVRANWQIPSISRFIPWIANYRLGTTYPTSPTGTGWGIEWTDWTHASPSLPIDSTPPARITDMSSS